MKVTLMRKVVSLCPEGAKTGEMYEAIEIEVSQEDYARIFSTELLGSYTQASAWTVLITDADREKK